jgi:hypothetical protein
MTKSARPTGCPVAVARTAKTRVKVMWLTIEMELRIVFLVMNTL